MCELLLNDHLDRLGSVKPTEKETIAIGKRWLMIETCEFVRNGLVLNGTVRFERKYFMLSKIKNIEVQCDNIYIILNVVYCDGFKERVSKHSQSSIDEVEVQKVCDVINSYLKNANDTEDDTFQRRFKRCSICDMYVRVEEVICPNCGHDFEFRCK